MTTQGISHLELESVKASLGPLHHVDLTAYDIVSAHRELGAEVGKQLQIFLQGRLASLEHAELVEQIRRARQARSALVLRLRSPRVGVHLRHAVDEYLRCLAAWARGSQLASFVHQNLRGLRVDGVPVSEDDLAILLQNEDAGCQTGVLREDGQRVILWHTEESGDPQGYARFDRLRLVSFKTGGPRRPRAVTAFVYPDLLPGSAFAWSGGTFAQAVDTLHVKRSDDPLAIPADAVAWIRLFLAGGGTSTGIARPLAPFSGGYALTSVRRTASSVDAVKIEFAGNRIVSSALPKTRGTALFQVNLFSDPGSRIASENEDIDPERRRLLSGRGARTQRALKRIVASDNGLARIFRMVSSRVGEGYAYCNPSVKAYFVCRMSLEEGSMWVGAGPAMPRDELFTRHEELGD